MGLAVTHCVGGCTVAYDTIRSQNHRVKTIGGELLDG
jgi:hypothetical protein